MQPMKNPLRFLDLNVLECGQEKCIPLKRLEPFSKKGYTIHFIQSGSGYVNVNGYTKPLGANEIFVMFPDEVMAYYPKSDSPWSYNWVILDGMNVEALLKECGITRQNPFAAYEKNNSVSPLFCEIYEAYLNGGNNIALTGSMFLIFAKMVEARGYDHQKQLGRLEGYYQRTVTFINNNYSFNITVSDMARNISVSPKYLSGVFEQICGVSPKSYLTKVRMEMALALMKRKGLLIKDIAAWVGYIDQLHFSKEFRKYYGVSPKEMYQKVSGEENA